MTLERWGSPELEAIWRRMQRPRRKQASWIRPQGAPNLALKEGKRQKLEDLQALWTRRDPRDDSVKRKTDTEGRGEPGQLGSEGRGQAPCFSPEAHRRGAAGADTTLKVREEKFRGFLF